jgi:chemotaxis protein MotB
MAEGEARHDIIIVRRYEDEEHHHSNSTWKVAHADFMTAMMAFFLIMWLLNATDEKSRQQIANYFNPIKLTDNQPNRKGLMDPAEPTVEEGSEKGGKEPEQKVTAGLRYDGPYPMTLGPMPGDASTPPKESAVSGNREQMVFQDPYAALAELAAEAEGSQGAGAASTDVVIGASGPSGGGSEVVRDPFDPIYWQTSVSTEPAQTERTAAEATGPAGPLPPPADGRVDATKALAEPPVAPEIVAAVTIDAGAASGSGAAQDPEVATSAAETLARDLALALRASGQTPHLEVVGTTEGVLVSLTDDVDFSMFPIGSAVPDPRAVVALQKIGRVLAGRSGELVVRGHTDARPFRSETYDNWRLSTARAHMAYYMLMRGGIDERRFRKIEGFADRAPRDPSDPQAAINRRIDILIREPAS